jgi:Protein of unknown function (DUF2795)
MVTDIWAFSDRAIAVVDLAGYEVEATDGRVGRVNRSIGAMGSEHLVVDPFGRDRTVIVPAGLIESIDTDGRRVKVNRTQQELKRAPAYDAARGVDASYRSALSTHYAPSRGGSGMQQEASSAARSTGAGRTRSRRSSAGKSRSRSRSQRSEPTKAELYSTAKRLGIEGRSKMSKAQLERAVERASDKRGSARSKEPANPVEVQAFLEGVNYPARKGQLVKQAQREGANPNVRSTLERLPDKQFEDPTDVSEAIGRMS